MEIVGDSEDITDEHIHNLKYCKSVLNEVLRLRPPVTCKYFHVLLFTIQRYREQQQKTLSSLE
jgi:hypothetical protein